MIDLPQEVIDALKELREFNHKKSAFILEVYIKSLTVSRGL